MPIMVRVMITTEMLIQQIDAFLARTGMAPSTFGAKAVNDGKLVARLKAGGSVSLATAESIQRFILMNERPATTRASA